ncbi:MAG: YDG domain-containing protein, partial [Rhodoferax sp.]
QITGLVVGEGATIHPTASFTYATANAGASDSNAITGKLTQNNYVANSGTLLSNYMLAYAPTGYGTINKADLHVNGVYASNKVYDTNNDATVNIGNGQLAGLADVDKSKTAITLTVGNGTPGSIAGDGTVTGSTVAGTFASSDAGNGQTVSTIFSLGGTSADNYNLVIPSLTANIAQAPLTIGGIVGNNKVYDGTTNVTFGANNSYTFDVNNATLSGFVGSDNASDVTLSAAGTTGTFSTSNVGNNLSVTGVNGFSLGAGTAGNKSNDYYVVQPTGLTANITPRPLSVTITGNPTKVYDGATSATLTASDYTIGAVAGNPYSGWVSGQGATLPQSATASYASPDVNGVNGSVVNSTLVSPDWKVNNSGTLLSNYVLPTSATGAGTITSLVLNLSATRVYDTTANIYSSLSGNVTNADNASVFGTLSGLNGDQFTVNGIGVASSKNVATYTSGGFGIGTLGLVNAGSNSATEKVSNYTLVSGVDTYTITKAPLNITGASVTPKVYDGTTTATVAGATLTNGGASGDVLPGDNVLLSSGNIAGTFNNKNAGIGKTVTINGGDITGTDAGNYAIVQPSDLTGTINQRPVTISGTRSYNALATAVGSTTSIWATPGAVGGNASSGVVSGDSVKVNGGNGSTVSADVGTYNSDSSGGGLFNATGLTLSNSNYVISSTGDQFQITPYVINFTGSSTYTGNPTVSVGAGKFLNGSNVVSATDSSFATGVNGETLALNGPYTLANSGNAGTNTTAASGLSLATGGTNTGKLSNYQFGNVKYTINPYVLSFSGSRDYDGTKNVNSSDLLDATTGSTTLGSATFTGLNGDTFTVSGTGSLSSANKGNNGGNASGISGTPTGTTQIGVSGLTLVGAGGTGTDLPSNYTFIGGNDTYDINAKLVTISGERVYDGLTDANGVQSGTSWVFSGVTSADHSKVSVAGNGSVSSANIGSYGYGSTTGGTFDYSGLTLAGAAASNYTLGTNNTFIIDPYKINLSGSRAYNGASAVDIGTGNFLNGTNVVSAIDGSFATGVNGETLTLDGPYNLSSKNAGTTHAALNAASGDGLSVAGSTAGNYIIGTVDYTVSKAVLNLSGTRVYDGSTDVQASAFGSNGVLTTGIGTETVDLSGTGQVGNKNVGTDKPFTGIGSLALANGGNGGLASNYTLVGGTDVLSITPKHIDATVTAANKVYDATDTATGTQFGSTGAGGAGTGVIAGDTVGFANTGATFSDANVANGKTVTATGIATSGADASNYLLDNSTATTTASLSGSSLAGVLGGDAVTLGNDTTGTFVSPNAGSEGVTTGMTIGGADAGNYLVVQPTGLAGIIKPYVLGFTGQRVYDATTNAYGTDLNTVTGLNGDTFTVSGNGSVSSKNVGTYNGVGGSSFGLGNLALVTGGSALSSNYTLVGGTDKYTITPATLTVAGTMVGTKTYDDNTTASLNGSTLTGVLGGDAVTLGNDNTGTFVSPNAGMESVTVAMTIGGAGAGNYLLAQPTALSGTINPYVLNLSGTRIYDGSTNAQASLFGNGGVLSGIDGQTVILSGMGQVGNKNVGTDKPFTGIGSLALANGGNGGLAGNYTLVGGTDMLSITPKSIVVDATGTNKIYDGSTLDTVALASSSVVTGDSLQFGYAAANFADPNIGNDKLVTVTGVQLSGAGASNYRLVNSIVYTAANIIAAQGSAFGVTNGMLASVDSVLRPTELATPYGLAPQDTVGTFTGNKKRLHHPVERNVSRHDFTSGLALKVIDGGMRMPVQALPGGN